VAFAALAVFAVIGALRSLGGRRTPDPPAPPTRRARLLPIIVIASRKIQVTNRANSDAATETGPLV
jgi:hypothetical protein